MSDDQAGFGTGRRAAVITCSTRAAAGDYADETGPVIVERLRGWGFACDDARVVPDGDPVGLALREALAGGADVVVTTGGTGISPSDATPEQTRPVLDAELPGVAEAFRFEGVQHGVPTAVLSRGLAGVARSTGTLGRAFVVNLPGSKGGVEDGLGVIGRIGAHTLQQLAGGSH